MGGVVVGLERIYCVHVLTCKGQKVGVAGKEGLAVIIRPSAAMSVSMRGPQLSGCQAIGAEAMLSEW